jgi:hypothetical protein
VGALAGCGACSDGSVTRAKEPTAPAAEARADGRVRELFRGASAQAPIAGLWLGARPVVFFDDPAGTVPELDTQRRLAAGEALALSRDWTRLARSRSELGQTLLFFDGSPFSICGRAGLALDSLGRTSVAWTRPDEDTGEAGRLSILGAGAEVLAEREVEWLDWVEVAASGERIALGGTRETLVLDRGGSPVARLRAAERGRLSSDGAWLALESGGERRRFSLVALRAEPRVLDFEAREGAVSLAFDPAGARLVRVTPSGLQAFRLEGEKAVIESELPPPAGFAWRSAAFSAGGSMSAGRIRVIERPRRNPAIQPEPDSPGKAELGVDLFSAPAASAASVVWEVTDWNHRAPEVAFGAGDALFAVAWPSAFEVRP